MKRIFYCLIIAAIMVACADNDDFSTASGLRLTLPADTVELDTVFSRTASSTYTFWVHNENSSGIRLTNVKLAKGNQTGFRVNVDGSYLDNSNGSQVSDLEIRSKDSLLVFVELTASETRQTEPQLVEDNLVFTMESGAQQKINLRAWAWDALRWDNLTVTEDTVIEAASPIIVTGTIMVAEGVTLTLRNTALYFHDQAGIDVAGTLQTEHCLMRGDRLDRMFSNLPYDRVSGQWGGVHFLETSVGNVLTDTEIRNATESVIVDSAAIDVERPRLVMERCIVHNAEGAGVETVNAYIVLRDCQLTNTLGDCLAVYGGMTEVTGCTIAQFYPFSADRGVALLIANCWNGHAQPLLRMECRNSILTGYKDDVITGMIDADTTTVFNYMFEKSLIRTPRVEGSDSVWYTQIIWESPNDSIEGKKQFKTIDEVNLYYDFHLDSLSTAKGLGCYR